MSLPEQTDGRDAAPVRRAGRPRNAALDGAILQATATEYIARGYAGLSVEAVASRAGVARTTVYRRWSTKDDLLLACIGSTKGLPPDVSDRPLRDGLLALTIHHASTSATGQVVALMRRFAADAPGRPSLWERFETEVVEPRRALYRDRLAAAVRRGEIAGDADLDWVVTCLISPIVHTGTVHNGRVSEHQVVFLVDALLAGLQHRPASAT